MVYYITNKKTTNLKVFKGIPSSEGMPILWEWLEGRKEYCYDLETTGLDPFKNKIVLEIIGDKDTQFVIDRFNVTENFLNTFRELTAIGHNLKFDREFTRYHLNFDMPYCYDTMLAEQRILQAEELASDLATVTKRRIGKYRDKEIRESFIGFTENDEITDAHIQYAVDDILDLENIKDSQGKAIELYNLHFIVNLENKLSPIVGLMESRGFRFDTDKWIKNIKNSEATVKEKSKSMDALLLELRDTCSPTKRLYFDKSKLTSKRTAQKNLQTDIFGEVNNTMQKFKDKRLFNYGSTDQIKKIFGALEQPLPTKEDVYAIPYLNNNFKLEESAYSFTTQSEFLKAYIIERHDNMMIPFIKDLLTYKEAQTAVNSFGYNYLEKVNPVTNRIHTQFRQAHAVTSRFQSGGGKNQSDRFNAQNVPGNNDYRSCFMAEVGNSFTICDWSGAEAIIMGDKAGDLTFLENRDDLHSFLATKAWRAIYAHRAKDTSISNDERNDYIRNSMYFVVSKKENKHLRTQFKGATFGVPYGVYAKKLAKALNITVEEAQIVIDMFSTAIPKVMENRKANVEFVLGWLGNKWSKRQPHGYLILNKRTNSRIWFPPVINSMRAGTGMEFMEINPVQNAARNYDIQGTQADMMKEAIVELYYKYIIPNKLTNKVFIRLTIHDELVVEQPLNMDGVSKEWDKNNRCVVFIPDNPIHDSEENCNYYEIYNNPHVLGHVKEFGKFTHISCSIPQLVKYVMNEVANRYLTHVKMNSEMKVTMAWEK